MSPPSTVKRSRVRRAGETTFGMILLSKQVLMIAVAALLLVAGVWKSWDTAQHAMFAERTERGTLTIEKCGDNRCSGPLVPDDSGGTPLDRVSIDKIVAADVGETVPVALRPHTETAIRTGATGVLYAWTPLGGSLMLAGLVVAGGLRLVRTGWVIGLLGAASIGASFVTL